MTSGVRGAVALSVLLLGLASAPVRLAGQIATPGAALAGTAETATALARGFEAVATNPAHLGLDGNPRVSVALMSARVLAGLGPVTFGDLSEFGGDPVPREVKERWLASIADEGLQSGTGGVEVAPLAISVGPFALQLSTVGLVRASLDPAGAELLMFGNRGRTGEPAALEPEGTSLDLFAYSTAALSYGYRIPFDPAFFGEGERLAVGVTATYTAGHALVALRDAGSVVASDPVTADIHLPSLETGPDAGLLDGGFGFGADLGLAYEGGPLVVSVVGRNLIHTFAWDTASLVYRPNTLFFSASTTAAEFDRQAAQLAPPALHQVVEDFGFGREVEGAFGVRVSPRLQVAGAVAHRFGESMEVSPATRVGFGAEYRVLPFLPVRAGVASVTGGFQAAGGATAALGPLGFSAALSYRSTDTFDGLSGALALTFRGR